MKEPSRALLLGGVAIAALLAVAGGFLFFTNLPEMGAARSQIMAAEPHLQKADIDRIIEARNASAPRPTEVASATLDNRPESGALRARMPGAAHALSANEAHTVSDAVAPVGIYGGAAPAAPPANPGDDQFDRGHYQDAVASWRKDASNGDRWSAYRLGMILLKGQDDQVKADPEEGLKWLRLAAEKNEPHAQFELGSLYQTGTAVKADDVEAAKWLLKSADRANVAGQSAIAPLLVAGKGIAKDRVEALKFYILAGDDTAQGLADADARSAIETKDKVANAGADALKAEMSLAEIKEAKKRAAIFQPIRD